MGWYPKRKAGEWLRPPKKKPFRFMCCDCALVHKIWFRVHEGRSLFKVDRDQKATTAARKRRHITLERVYDRHAGAAGKRGGK